MGMENMEYIPNTTHQLNEPRAHSELDRYEYLHNARPIYREDLSLEKMGIGCSHMHETSTREDKMLSHMQAWSTTTYFIALTSLIAEKMLCTCVHAPCGTRRGS